VQARSPTPKDRTAIVGVQWISFNPWRVFHLRQERSMNAHSDFAFQGLLLAAMLVSAWPEAALAFELALPPVGTEINFAFNPPEKFFEIADDEPSSTALENQLNFSHERHLRVGAIEPQFIVVDITLRGSGLADVMETIWYKFDEMMSLVDADGSILETVKNSSFGYRDDDREVFSYGWQFTPPAGARLSRLEWKITPALLEGAQLPPTLDLSMYMWGAPLVVVPEPRAIPQLCVAAFCVWAAVHKNRRRSYSSSHPAY
jgi:hypothetical protein